MRSVLFLTYYYPPVGGVGVQRVVKYLRYLPEFDWDPVVITSDDLHSGPRDESLTAGLPPADRLQRAHALKMPAWMPWRLRNLISRWLLVVDSQLGWYPYALQEAERTVSRSSIKAIYSTSAPYTTHLIALALKCRTGLPWIADFRDPWVNNPALQPPTRWHKTLITRLESQVCSGADRILVTTESLQSDLRHRYPGLPEGKFLHLPNGYDPEDFDALDHGRKDPVRFTILHTGSFYRSGLTPEVFLSAVQKAIAAGEISPQKVHIRFIGNLGTSQLQLIQNSGIAQLVECTGFLPYKKSLQMLLEADVLLLVNHAGASGRLIIPAKTYEYLAARKPILALTSAGALSDLLHATSAGSAIDPLDAEAVASEIVRLYRLWENKELEGTTDPDKIIRFSRREITRQLAAALNILAGD